VSRVVAAGDEGARAIIDGERYMTLATADADGVPWANPVWYAPDGYSELIWVSNPEARHSRNLATRPELGIVIFDTSVTPGDGQAVYMEATAAQVEDGLDVFSARSVAQGMPAWDEEIAPAIRAGKNILISAHGNSLRAVIKMLDNISDTDIVGLNIPNGTPLVYELDADLKPIRHYYLGDQAAIAAAMAAVANQGKAK